MPPRLGPCPPHSSYPIRLSHRHNRYNRYRGRRGHRARPETPWRIRWRGCSSPLPSRLPSVQACSIMMAAGREPRPGTPQGQQTRQRQETPRHRRRHQRQRPPCRCQHLSTITRRAHRRRPRPRPPMSLAPARRCASRRSRALKRRVMPHTHSSGHPRSRSPRTPRFCWTWIQWHRSGRKHARAPCPPNLTFCRQRSTCYRRWGMPRPDEPLLQPPRKLGLGLGYARLLCCKTPLLLQLPRKMGLGSPRRAKPGRVLEPL